MARRRGRAARPSCSPSRRRSPPRAPRRAASPLRRRPPGAAMPPTDGAPTIVVRQAGAADADAICRIYNHGIAGRQATFEKSPRAPAEIQEWLTSGADGALLVGVEDPVLREAREAAVREAELLREPVGHPGVPPPLQRHEVDVDQSPGREPAAHRDDRQADPAPPGPVERDEPPERVGAERSRWWRSAYSSPLAVAPPPSHDWGSSQ